MPTRLVQHTFIVFVIMAILFSVSGSVFAWAPRAVNVIQVSTTLDEYDEITPNMTCSLREAIQAVNDGAAFGGCPAPSGSPPEIQVGPWGNATYLLSRTGTPEDLNKSGDLDILTTMNIIAPPGSTVLITTSTGERVMDISYLATVTLGNLSITGGSGEIWGGGIRSNGVLTLNNVTMSNNSALQYGGAISSSLFPPDGSTALTIHDSVFTDNDSGLYGGAVIVSYGDFVCDGSVIRLNDAELGGAGLSINTQIDAPHASITRCYIGENGDLDTDWGGGLLNYGNTNIQQSIFLANVAISGGNVMNYSNVSGFAQLTITQSEISQGTAYYGGGIENTYNANLNIDYTTISYNVAYNYGGGILQWSEMGDVNLDHVTLADNSSYDYTGSAIAQYIDSGTALPVHLNNSIITFSINDLCYGSLDSASTYNVLSFNACGLTGPTNIFPSSVLLTPLKDNGGEYTLPYRAGVTNTHTWTHALMQGSPAIDWTICDIQFEDQRGFPVPVDGNLDGYAFCDAGAYERQLFSFISLLKKP